MLELVRKNTLPNSAIVTIVGIMDLAINTNTYDTESVYRKCGLWR